MNYLQSIGSYGVRRVSIYMFLSLLLYELELCIDVYMETLASKLNMRVISE
jgi:hypothetical protein